MLALCFSKGTFGCKKQKFTETGLSVKANWLERNEAISQNPRAGSGAGDFKGSDQELRGYAEPRQGMTSVCLCFSLKLLFHFPLVLQASFLSFPLHEVFYSKPTNEMGSLRPNQLIPVHDQPPSAWSPHLCPTEAKRLTQMPQTGPPLEGVGGTTKQADTPSVRYVHPARESFSANANNVVPS